VSPRTVRVALLGYGCVGSSVDRLLTDRADEIEETTGLRLRVVRALVRDLRKPRPFQPPPGVLTTDFGAICEDASIDVVAEVMGGLTPTEDYFRALLAAGKPVVTANKQLLARRGRELARAAELARLPVRFEAAVCGAVPVVRILCEALPPRSVRRIVGVVNGTTNYLLTRMEHGRALDDALDEARDLGYAESDARDDLNGSDAAAKMALLASTAFGTPASLDQVEFSGIADISPRDLEEARRAGRRVRLVGEAAVDDRAVVVRVAPTELDEHHELARVPAAFNEVALEGDGFGRLTLRGPGAGGPETASAVVGDLLAIAAGRATSHLARLGGAA